MKILDMFNPVLRDVKYYFDFLFNRGYKIRYTDFKGRAMLLWDIILESPNCLVHIYQERSEVFLTIAPLSAINMANQIEVRDEFALQTVIYYISHGKHFVGFFEKEVYRDRKKQLEILANLLKEYIDQIKPYCGSYEFQQYKNDFLAAQREYNNLLVK